MSDPSCATCKDEHYILHGCCNSKECGCRGQPVLMTNCVKCNPSGDKPEGDYVRRYSAWIEYKQEPTND